MLLRRGEKMDGGVGGFAEEVAQEFGADTRHLLDLLLFRWSLRQVHGDIT